MKDSDKNIHNEIVFVTASNLLYHNVCDYCVLCARKYGKFDKILRYSIESDLPDDYRSQYKKIFDTPRGAGLWLWKVYFIDKALREECHDGDWLFYADAASFFFRNIHPVVRMMKGDIFAVNVPFIEEEFTKCETFELMGLCGEEYTKSRQFHASFMAFRKTAATIKFVEEWKSCCEDIRLLSEDVLFGKQIPTFCAHRNDQSIFSLLCKKYGVVPSQDPSQYGITGYGSSHGFSYAPLQATTDYPFCIMLHKQQAWGKIEKVKNWLRVYKRFVIIGYRKLLFNTNQLI